MKNILLFMSFILIGFEANAEQLQNPGQDYKAASTTQNTARTCRHEDFGVERWEDEEIVTQSSGWKGGGSDLVSWCNAVANNFIQNRAIGSKYQAITLSSREDGPWAGRIDRTRLFNFHCKVKMQWNPVYKERQDSIRCGTY